MKLKSLAVVLVLGMFAAACTGTDQAGQKQTFVALGGAALGGLAGSQIGGGRGQLAATAAGALLGGLLGSEVGKSLDRADEIYMARTTQDALERKPTGQVAEWTNPDSGHRGTITPVETYQRDDGRYCREFQQTVTVGGRTEQAYGTACRQPDGTWQIQ